MRILYLTAESFLTGPIIQSQVVNLLERVAEHEDVAGVTLVTYDDTPAGDELRAHGSTKIRHLLKRNRGHLRNILHSLGYVLARRREYDLVHVRSYLPMFAGVLAKLLGKTVVFDPRGLFAEELSYFDDRRAFTFVFKRLEWLFCGVADAVVVVSEPFREHLVERHRIPTRRVHVIPTFSSRYAADAGTMPGSNLREELGWHEATIFVYSGSLERWQRIDDVITFFARASQRIQAARFLFLSTQAEELVRLLRGRLPEGSYAARSVPSRALTNYLAQCNVGVLFRDDHIINRVSAPIKVKDYLLAGLPLLISDRIGDSSEFVRRHDLGIVLGGLSEAEMERALDVLEARDARWDRQHIADVARASFDIAPVSARYLELYRTLHTKAISMSHPVSP